MAIITVKGEIETDNLGITDIHDHLYVDLTKDYLEDSKNRGPEYYIGKGEINIRDEKVNINNLGYIRINPFIVKDNAIISDRKLLEKELLEFKKLGGKTIVDPTTKGLGRNPVALKKISLTLDINIITCTGYYRQKFHPPGEKNMSIEDIYNEMIKEVTIGISNTGIRAGIIGELGTGDVIHPDEKRVLIAAARVNNEFGIPLVVHKEPWAPQSNKILNILEKNGANLCKVYICHLDLGNIDFKECVSIIKRGAYIGFDTFGYVDQLCELMRPNSDSYRINNLLKLIDKGYVHNILIGQDIAYKHRLHRYGGYGYDHFLRNILPILRYDGVSEEEIDTLLIENPKRFLNIEKSL